MVPYKNLLQKFYDKLNSGGHGSGREQCMQVCLTKKDHFSIYVPLRVHQVLLGRVLGVFERDKFWVGFWVCLKETRFGSSFGCV